MLRPPQDPFASLAKHTPLYRIRTARQHCQLADRSPGEVSGMWRLTVASPRVFSPRSHNIHRHIAHAQPFQCKECACSFVEPTLHNSSRLPTSHIHACTVTPAFDQPRTPALPLPIECHLLGSGNQLHPTGVYQLALPLSHHTRTTHPSPPTHTACLPTPQPPGLSQDTAILLTSTGHAPWIAWRSDSAINLPLLVAAAGRRQVAGRSGWSCCNDPVTPCVAWPAGPAAGREWAADDRDDC